MSFIFLRYCRTIGRDDWIRTSDFLHPMQALYQAELRPEKVEFIIITSSNIQFLKIFCNSYFSALLKAKDNSSRMLFKRSRTELTKTRLLPSKGSSKAEASKKSF